MTGEAFRLEGLVPESLAPLDLEEQRQEAIRRFLSDDTETSRTLLIRDHRKPDRYGRREAVPLGAAAGSAGPWSLQEALLARGLARVEPTGLGEACAQRLLATEARARIAGTGLWTDPNYRMKKAAEMPFSATLSTYQVVFGRPITVSRRPDGTSYLNFGRIWKRDFTVTLSKKALADWEAHNKSLDDLSDAPIYVRGWIEEAGGPMIRVSEPNQLWLTEPDAE